MLLIIANRVRSPSTIIGYVHRDLFDYHNVLTFTLYNYRICTSLYKIREIS